MKNFILGLFLLFSIDGMAIHTHHFHHYYHPHHHSYVTTQTKKVQSHKVVRPIIRRHNTKVINTFWRNGILYYIILNPKRGHVYGNEWVLCEGCKKVLVKKGVKYCNKCRRINRQK